MLFLPSKTGANLQKKIRFPKLLLFELKEQFVKNASYDIASRLNSDYEMLTRPGEQDLVFNHLKRRADTDYCETSEKKYP